MFSLFFLLLWYTKLSNWLFSNGICQAEVFENEPEYFNKEVPFIDQDHRYEQGIEFYAKRFQHCAEDDNLEFIMDATPRTLLYPEHVYSIYNQTKGGSSLKIIVILREPVSRELSLYNHKKFEYTGKKNETPFNQWINDVASPDGTVMSFDNYTKNV